MDHLSSMYIDNEMDLDEKRQFVKKIRSDQEFYNLTIDLLSQEQMIREMPVATVPLPVVWQRPSLRSFMIRLLRPIGPAVAGFAAAVLVLWAVFVPPDNTMRQNRFVLFAPAAGMVEVAGSFTGWERVPLQRVGDSGYWEINLRLSAGEHRYAFILDGNRQLADPTLPTSERDDFGGANSILNVSQANI